MADCNDRIPDVRDGLTRIERVVLVELEKAQREFRGRNVPTATLYGRVVEHVDISVEELQICLQRLVNGLLKYSQTDAFKSLPGSSER